MILIPFCSEIVVWVHQSFTYPAVLKSCMDIQYLSSTPLQQTVSGLRDPGKACREWAFHSACLLILPYLFFLLVSLSFFLPQRLLSHTFILSSFFVSLCLPPSMPLSFTFSLFLYLPPITFPIFVPHHHLQCCFASVCLLLVCLWAGCSSSTGSNARSCTQGLEGGVVVMVLEGVAFPVSLPSTLPSYLPPAILYTHLFSSLHSAV